MNAPVDVTNIRIETPRLILRPWLETDLEDFYEYAKVDGVGQMAGWLPHKSVLESKAILDRFITHRKTLALELKENGKVIGSLGIEDRAEERESDILRHMQGRELGYVLSKDYWGRGLMPEAVQAVINYCFDVLDYDYLTCGHYVSNKQSRRVIEKSGFQFLKEEKHETRYGTVEDVWLYVLYNPHKGPV